MIYLVLIPTAIMVISDFKHREIVLWILSLFSILSVGAGIYSYGWKTVITNVAYNILLLSYLSIGLLSYLWIRNRRFTNPLKRHLGIGDMLFILALTPLFGVREFLLFLLVSMISALVWWLISGRQKTIPLVGVLGIVLGIYLMLYEH